MILPGRYRLLNAGYDVAVFDRFTSQQVGENGLAVFCV